FQKKIKKREFLLQAGNVCREVSFTVKGCVKVFYIDDNGTEVIMRFFDENWWVVDMFSLVHKKPSNYNIDAIEDSEFLVLSYDSAVRLYEKIPKIEEVFRATYLKNSEILAKRLTSLISEPAEKRYSDFIEEYPSIYKRIPQKLLANYLGVTPSFLSRMKKNIPGNDR
ncbi:Crp/Fnr family transcriptional regulator, partial [uncultured Chryseobacterium sp.]|uniref:Crp/Fnr family transcriptional regulator n=1 Tax=uncultured Chryseobacterium sp. TaxID=259322 RepID=UPI0027DD5872